MPCHIADTLEVDEDIQRDVFDAIFMTTFFSTLMIILVDNKLVLD